MSRLSFHKKFMLRVLPLMLGVIAIIYGLISHPQLTTAATMTYQAWFYPTAPTDYHCSATTEYRDGRLQNGVLKPQYYGVTTTGTLQLLAASDPSFSCGGYSAANAADVKAHSAEQYMTVSTNPSSTDEGITSLRALTGSSSKSNTAITTWTNLVVSMGFTGVDVDFEDYWNWNASDNANFNTFITNLAASLHAQGRKLQVEGPPDTQSDVLFNYGTVLADGADQVVLMAYDDEYQSTANPCLPFTPYTWLHDLVVGVQNQIPAAQRSHLVVGLPSEAYSVTISSNCQAIVGNLTYQDMENAPGFSTDPNTIASRRDPSSGEVRWTANGTFYDYNDTASLDAKLAIVQSLGVTSVSVWDLGGHDKWFSTSSQPTATPTKTNTPIPPTATKTSTSIPSATNTPISNTDGSPYSGSPYAIPGKVEAENYNNGGEGVAYHDAESANQGGAYRLTEGVDVEPCTDPGCGYDVGYTVAGEWMKYTVNVASSGSYNFDFRVASALAGGAFHLEVDNVNVTGTLTVPNTGGWDTWTDVTANNINLSAGQHVFKWATDAANGNYNWFSVASSAGTATFVPPTKTPGTATTVNDSDAGITYSGTWRTSANRGLGDYQNDVHYTSTTNDYFQYTFIGTGIDYITEKNSDEGNIDIFIDGTFQQTVSANTASRLVQQILYSKTGLAAGSHTITGIKTSGKYLLVDAFKVYP